MVNKEEILAILFRVPYIRNRQRMSEYPYVEELLCMWNDFVLQFPDEEACYIFLCKKKWPNGFRCPRCHNVAASKITTRKMPIYQCYHCQHQTTLTAGTIMEQTRLPLQKWLAAFFFLSLDQVGVNAFQLHLLLQVTYKTAWALHRKIRQTISQTDINCLLGEPMVANDCEKNIIHTTKINNIKAVNNAHQMNNSGTDTVEPSGVQVECVHNKQNTYGIMFERAPQHKAVMIAFEMSESNHSSYSSTLQQMKIKQIPVKYMVSSCYGNRVLTPYVEAFKKNHFANKITVTHAPRMSYYKRKVIQRAFDTIMHRFNQTYGATIGNKYLQLYYDEVCFYYFAIAQQISIFQRLAQLSMSWCKSKSHISNLLSR
ncbi:transposase [Paenibacillus yanchengensis]|uniref:Transposase n=1 Tax=Paenibacillus yanchengensis TaxID=2035833 RepID=A0ABW4YGC5_9BACL